MNEESLFHQALQQPDAAARAAFLDRSCANQPELRARLEKLLKAHEAPVSLFDKIAVEMDTTLDAAGSSGDSDIDEGSSFASVSSAEKPGTCIGPYQLLRPIGVGGMGMVWLAEQERPVRRQVALKIIKPGMDSQQVIARFEQERQALALMDHVNIAKVLDAGTTENGRPFFVMELIHGNPITQYCDDKRLTVRERLELFMPVCQAIQHAHQKGIIHRDVKPSNVLVTVCDDKAVPKVIDFGVAKAVEQRLTEQTLCTQHGAIIGTFEYMSPEQAETGALGIDTRSDIYSLGVLLYELLTGTTPLERQRIRAASSYTEIVRWIREEEPPKPSTRLSHSTTLPAVAAARKTEPVKLVKLVRGELDWIAMRAFEKDRNRRYETANGLARDIQRYLADEPVQACPPSAGYRFRKFVHRERTALVMSACILLALAGIAGGVGWAVRNRMAQQDQQRLREEALSQSVESTLAETEQLIQQERWLEALAVVDRAEQLLAAADRTDRPQRLIDLRNELLMARRLEEIYNESKQEVPIAASLAGVDSTMQTPRRPQDPSEEDFFWGREQDRRFNRAFRELGIDMETLSAEEAVARIRATSIRQALVQSLDSWAAMRKRAQGLQEGFWKRLLEVARQADPDEWRNRFREALLRRDRAALEKLAEEIPIGEVPPATAYVLGHSLRELGALEKAMAVLRQAHRRHPDDFWLNDALGDLSKNHCRPPRYDDALRYFSVTAALRPHNWRPHSSVAWLLETKGETNEAIAEYSEMVELDPKNPLVWRARANAYSRLHQYDKAVADFSEAIQLDPKIAEAWNERGCACAHLGQFGKGLVDVSKAIELEPKNATLWSNRGNIYNVLRKYDKAVADLSKAIQLNPKLAVAWCNRGSSYYFLRQYTNALADHSKAIQLDPKLEPAWNNRGLVYNALQQYDKAVADLSKAIQLNTKAPMAWRNRGDAYRGLRQSDKAVADFSRAVQLDPKDVVSWNNRGAAYGDLEQYGKAVADYSKAIQLDPKHAASWNNRGTAYVILRQYDNALADLSEAIRLDPKLVQAWNNRGYTYNTLRQYGKALADLNQAIRLDPKFVVAWKNRGIAYNGLRQYGNALADLNEAIKIDPNFTSALGELAGILANCPDAKVRDPRRAVELAKKAVKLAPTEGTLWRTLGAAHYGAGDWKAAIENLKKSMELLKGGNSLDWFFLAMAHWQLGEKDQAHQWYKRAVQWMDKNQPDNDELRRFCSEAAELLGMKNKSK